MRNLDQMSVFSCDDRLQDFICSFHSQFVRGLSSMTQNWDQLFYRKKRKLVSPVFAPSPPITALQMLVVPRITSCKYAKIKRYSQVNFSSNFINGVFESSPTVNFRCKCMTPLPPTKIILFEYMTSTPAKKINRSLFQL